MTAKYIFETLLIYSVTHTIPCIRAVAWFPLAEFAVGIVAAQKSSDFFNRDRDDSRQISRGLITSPVFLDFW